MKHLFEKVKLTAVLISLPLVLTSCPEPEPDFVDPVTKNAQLSSIDFAVEYVDYGSQSSWRTAFRYDENNKIKEIEEWWGDALNYKVTVFSWNPFSIKIEDIIINTTLSPDGYITYAKSRTDNEINILEYDNRGHLIKFTRQEEYKDESYFDERIFKWSDDLLVEVEINWTGEYSYGKEYGRGLYKVSYGKDANNTGIWPASFAECGMIYFEPGSIECPYVLQTGLLGVAPVKLPVQISLDGDTESGKHTERYYIIPRLDSEGRLSSETMDGINHEQGTYSMDIKYNYQ